MFVTIWIIVAFLYRLFMVPAPPVERTTAEQLKTPEGPPLRPPGKPTCT